MMLWMHYELVAADVEELLSDESFDALTISPEMQEIHQCDRS